MEKPISDQLNELFEQVRRYLNLRIDLLKLTLGEKLVRFTGLLMLRSLIMSTVFFALLFLGMAFAWWFGEITGNIIWGFLATAGLFFAGGVVVFIYRRPLIYDPLTRAFMRISGLDQTQSEGDEKEKNEV
jgi:hypothetical protein